MEHIEAQHIAKKNATLGEIRNARQLGYKGTHNLIWHACIECGKERWVQLVDIKKSGRRMRG